MMNKRIICCFLTFFLMLGVSFTGFTQTPVELKNLQRGVADLSKELAKSLPLNSSLGLNWADAHIGKVIPSAPPHFGVGASAGFTTMDIDVIKDLADYLGYDLDINTDKMFLPAYAAEARVGGIFLPFDVGFKFGYLPPMDLMNTEINYLLLGGDIRYAVLDGKSNTRLPNISIGVGLNYMRAGVAGKAGGGAHRYDFAGKYIEIDSPDVELNWNTLSLDFKAQISKSFFIFTPYLGLGGGYAWSKAGYLVKAKVTGDINAVKDYLNKNGLADMDVNGSEISSVVENNAFSFRVFGGMAFNLAVFKIDLTGLYSFRDSNYGASLGFRFQL